MGGTPRITAPVTSELLSVLTTTESFLGVYKEKGARLKDSEHYAAAAIQLEQLVKAIMAAQTSVSLLGRPTVGARFHVGAGTGLLKALDGATIYLTDVASVLLRGNNLRQYEKNHTVEVLGFLGELMGRITEDVQIIANNDLGRIRSKRVDILIATADLIAKIEAADVAAIENIAEQAEMINDALKATDQAKTPADDTTPGTPGDPRCTYPTGHGRCIWPTGHRSGTGATYCVGEKDPSRCRVDMGGGIRCMKPAGHFARNPKDEHVPAIGATFTD